MCEREREREGEHHNALDMTLFMRIATELHLKRLVSERESERECV